jgi:TolB protein
MDTVTGESILELVDPGANKNPTWSPGSDRIAFLSNRDDPVDWEVYVINLDGSGLTRLTDNQLNETNIIWSPTGEKIAVEIAQGQTYLMNPDGSDLHQITGDDLVRTPEGWSPDGRYLLLKSLGGEPGSPFQLSMYDLQTQDYTWLTDYFYAQATWSPDGRLISFVGFNDQTYDDDIFVINPDGSGKINLSHEMDKEDSQPAWSPDSRWLAFMSRRDDIADDTNYDIYIIRPDGSRLTQITSNIQSDSHPFWQP